MTPYTGTAPLQFTSPSGQAADYRIYGPLPAGEVCRLGK